MANYEMVMVRFNMDKDEAILYENLNKNNRAGHIKDILKEIFMGNGIEIARRSYIESIIKSMLSNMDYQKDIREEVANSEINNIDENELLSAVSSIMKGVK